MRLPLKIVKNLYGDVTEIVDTEDRLIASATSNVYAEDIADKVNKFQEAVKLLNQARLDLGTVPNKKHCENYGTCSNIEKFLSVL